MSVNVVDQVRSLISTNLTSQFASRHNVPEEQVKRFVDGGIPAILAFLLNQMETADGANTVHKLAAEADGGTNGNIQSLTTEDVQQKNPVVINTMTVLNRLFHDRWSVVSRMVAEYASMGHTASSSLLASLTTAILSVLGQKIKQDNLSASELSGWLLGQKEYIVNATPPGFNLAGAVGLSSVGSLGLGAANMSSGVKKPADTYAATSVPVSKGPNKWIFPVLTAVALLVLLWYFLNR